MNQLSRSASRLSGLFTSCPLPACGFILAVTENAQAHSPIEGIGTFYGYALHPLVVLPHALLLTATALLLGQQARSAARAGVAAMACGFLAALFLAPARFGPASAEAVLLLAASVAGILAAWRPNLPPSLAGVLGSVAGILMGLDSFPAEAPRSEAGMALAGLSAGFMALLVLMTGLSHGAENGWLRVALRILSSWIAAISLLALSFEIAGGPKGAG
jgi:urease accessory protein